MTEQSGRHSPSRQIHDLDDIRSDLFRRILVCLAETDNFSKAATPSFFVVYAHDNASEENVRFLIEWFGIIRSRMVSDKRPLPVLGSRAEDSARNIYWNQSCLLPHEGAPSSDDVITSVDKVILCASEVLKRYFEHEFTPPYIHGIVTEFNNRELFQKPNRTLFESLKDFVETHLQNDGFHHVLTELAFLNIRISYLKPHGIIPLVLNGDRTDYSSLFEVIGLQKSDLILELKAPILVELQRLFFKLLKHVYTEHHVLIDFFMDCFNTTTRNLANLMHMTESQLSNKIDSDIGVAQAKWIKFQNAHSRHIDTRPAVGKLDEQLMQVLGKLRNHDDVLGSIYQMAKDRQLECVRKRWKFTNPSGKRIVLRDKMENMIRWINTYRDLGPVATEHHAASASWPWAAVRYILETTVNDDELFKAVSDSLETIAKIITRHRMAEELLIRSSCSDHETQLLESALAGLYIEILRFLAMAVAIKDPLVAMNDYDLPKVLQKDHKVSQLTTMIERHAKPQDEVPIKELRQLMQSSEAFLTRLSVQEEKSTRVMEATKYRDLLVWLSNVNYSCHHQFHSDSRLEGTGEWLSENDNYIDWRSSSISAIMILHGIVGSGKTKIASWVIDSFINSLHSRIESSTQETAPIAYFYCSNTESEPERRDPASILRSVVRQITVNTTTTRVDEFKAHRSVLLEFEKRSHQSKKNGFSPDRLSNKECINIIGLVAETEPITIIIDALDEVEDDEPLHEMILGLDNVVRNAANVVKIFLTSRNGGPLFSLLPQATKIRISKTDNAADMIAFTQWQIDKAVSARRLLGGHLEEATKAKIIAVLTAGAGEMFLWVKLQLNRICCRKTEVDVQDAIRHLPTALEDIYNDALEHIASTEYGKRAFEIARYAFLWVLHACRPLSIPGLLQAVSMSFSQERLATDLTVFEIEDCCLYLICIDPASNMFRPIHPSVQLFLASRPDFANFEIQSIMAKATINSCCQLSPIEERPEGSHISAASSISFSTYAVMYWPFHCQQASLRENTSELGSQMISFVFEGPRDPQISIEFKFWLENTKRLVQRLSWADPMFKRLCSLTSPDNDSLFAAAEFGLGDLLEQLGQDPITGHECDRRNDLQQTPLYLASVSGHTNLARVLLQKGASVDLAGGKQGSPAHAAAFYGHKDVCLLLLERGASPRQTPDARPEAFANVVEAALAGGHEELGREILIKIAPTLEEEDLKTIMNEACRRGYNHIARWLQSQVPTLALSPLVETALTKAVCHGQVETIKFLLKEAHGKFDVLPLDTITLAALHGHENVIIYCLERGLDINRLGPFGSPLRVASRMGHDHIVRLLLDNGAKVGCDQPLQAAAFWGHVEVVKTLLYIGGLSADEGGDEYEPPLTVAAYRGHVDVVKVLLDAGADPRKSLDPKFRYANAFHAAVEGGNNSIVDLFNEKGFTLEYRVEAQYGHRARSHDLDASTFRKLNLTDIMPEQLEAEGSLTPVRPTGTIHQAPVQEKGPNAVSLRLYMDQVHRILDNLRLTGDGHAQIIGFFASAVECGNLKVVRVVGPEIQEQLMSLNINNSQDASKWKRMARALGGYQDWEPLTAAASYGHLGFAEYILSLRDSDALISMAEIESLLSVRSSTNLQVLSKALTYLENLCEGDVDKHLEAVKLLQYTMQTAAGFSRKSGVLSVGTDNPELLAMLLGSQGVTIPTSSPESIYQAWAMGREHAQALSVLYTKSPDKAAHLAQCLVKTVERGHFQNFLLMMCCSPPDTEKGFLIACRYGHTAIVEYLILKSMPSWQDRSRTMAKGLILASQSGHSNIVNLVLTGGADVNCELEYEVAERGPLIATDGFDEAFYWQYRYLPQEQKPNIYQRADPKDTDAVRDSAGVVSPLGACLVGLARFSLDHNTFNHEMVKQTLTHEIDGPRRLAFQTNHGFEPWRSRGCDQEKCTEGAASENLQRETLGLLLDKGARVDLLSSSYLSDHPLLLAIKYCGPKVIKHIAERMNAIKPSVPYDELTASILCRRFKNLEAAEEVSQCISRLRAESLGKQSVFQMLPNLNLRSCVRELMRQSCALMMTLLYISQSIKLRRLDHTTVRSHEEMLSEVRYEAMDPFCAPVDGLGALVREILSNHQESLDLDDQGFLFLLAGISGRSAWVSWLSRYPERSHDLELFWRNYNPTEINHSPPPYLLDSRIISNPDFQEGRPNISPLEAACFNGHLEFVVELLPVLHHIYPTTETCIARLESALYAAIVTEHSEVAAALIQSASQLQFSIQRLDPTIFTLAAKVQLPRIVELLIEAGVYVNSVGRPCDGCDEAPALYYACTTADPKIPQMLLAAGADATWVMPQGPDENAPVSVYDFARTPYRGLSRLLPDIVFHGKVSYRMSWSTDFSHTNRSGPLHISCAYGNVSASRALIERGANPRMESTIGTPLICAVQGNSLACVRLLLETIDGDDEEDLGKSLDKAVEMGASDIIAELLSWGAPVFGCAGRNTRNALVHAVEYRDIVSSEKEIRERVSITKALLTALENMEDLEALVESYAATSAPQRDPVQVAALRAMEFGDKECFELLANFLPAEISYFTDTMQLHAACCVGSLSTVERLVRQDIDVDVPDSYGDRPLHIAAHHLHYDILQFLLANGADVTYSSKNLGSPLMTAMEGCLAEMNRSIFGRLRDRIMEAELLEPGLPPKTYFGPAKLHGEMERYPTIHLEGERTGNWTKDEIGRITFYMKRQGHTPTFLLRTLQVLFKHGVEANPKPGYFGTALQIACFIRSETIVRLLLDQGADVNGTGGWLGSPLMAAIHAGNTGKSHRIIKLLLEKGADVSFRTERGCSVLNRACELTTLTSIRLLLEHGADVNEGQGALLERRFAFGHPGVAWALLRYGKGLRLKKVHLEIANISPWGYRTYLGKTAAEWLLDYRYRHPELCWSDEDPRQLEEALDFQNSYKDAIQKIIKSSDYWKSH
ncbi:MAG: hypothetical protein Q9191_000918 [Dirinaria sp. TL-2023a]